MKNIKENFNIVWYVLCWNEMPILPFMIDYWKLIANKVIVYDNNSTDGTLDFLKNFEWIEVRPYPIETNNTIDDEIHVKIKNECWKEQKNNNVDFVIVSDLDEVIWARDLYENLRYIKDKKFAVVKPTGYDFVSQEFPVHGDLLLHEQIDTCCRIPLWDKCILFQPDLVEEINYLPGAHYCNPIIKVNSEFVELSTLLLFHFKYLSVEYLIMKRFATKGRLSETNIKNNWGFEYQYNKEQIIQQFNGRWNNHINFKSALAGQIVYKSINDLSNTIRQNLWKIPENIDLIVGIPRSGMLCGILISQMLNKPIITLNDFLNEKVPEGGKRMNCIKKTNFKNILIIDDNVASGSAINEVKNTINNFKNKDKYNFIYSCVYLESEESKNMVDIYLENIRIPGSLLYLYEWNIMHFDAKFTEQFMCDIDGIVCKDPPDESLDINAYEEYIKNPIINVIPSRKIGAFVTYRLNKYRDITATWLNSLGISYDNLYMFNAKSYNERASITTPAEYKAFVYSKADWAILFIESDDKQAQEIAKLTHKPVFSFESGKMYKNL